MEGVVRTRVGYAGGTKSRPTYRAMGDHTECIQIDFDPAAVSYAELLDAFFGMHNPTRSVHSVQYESVILTHDETQEALALEAARRWSALLGKEPLTRIERYSDFTPAEDYHQKYALRADRAIMKQMRRHYPDDSALRESTAAARLNGYLYGAGSPLQLEGEISELGLDAAAQQRLAEFVSKRSR